MDSMERKDQVMYGSVSENSRRVTIEETINWIFVKFVTFYDPARMHLKLFLVMLLWVLVGSSTNLLSHMYHFSYQIRTSQ